MAQILIIGGHGKVALLTSPLLVEAGHRVNSVIRNPDHASEVESGGAQAVVADVESLGVDGLAELMRDQDVVVWSAGAGGGDPARTKAVDHEAAVRSMQAAAQAGVQRYIMVSYYDAGPDHGVDPSNSFYAYAEAKAAADEYLRGTDLNWTILGPSRLTLDEPTGRITVAGAGERGEPVVSRGNVAQVIAAVVEDESTVGRTIRFDDGDVPVAEALGG